MFNIQNFISFNGRIPRMTFWLSVLILMIIQWILFAMFGGMVLAFPMIASCNARNWRAWSTERRGRFVGTWSFVPTRSPQFSRNAFSSVCAASKVTPSFSRATTYRT